MSEHWEQVKALFVQALEVPVERRSLLLDEACRDNPALREEVQSLLDSNVASTQFLDRVAWDDGAGIRSQGEAFEGRLIGPYRIVSQIGRGGMGAVFLAVRADAAFQKRVAIKVVKRGMDTDDILVRFRHERETLARLDHPNIARLLDGGTTIDGLPYFVMEYVEGVPIDEYCQAHALAVNARLRLFHAVSDAVHYAHQNLVVHRDLKPDNILVTPDGTPKLLDFGIAKVLQPEGATGDSTATIAVGRVMTLRYASPEQVKNEPLTTASDVYSLGVLLYEVLTGRRPYTTANRSQQEAERVICDIEPEKPSDALRRPPDALRPSVVAGEAVGERDTRPELTPTDAALERRLTGDLDMIVLMAMRKEPARRYGSVEQFAGDISRHLQGLPVVAHNDTLGYRAGKFVRRHAIGVASAAAVLFMIIAGALAIAWQARIAAEQRDVARREAQKAAQINQFVRDMLASADPANRGRDVKVVEALDLAGRRIGTQLIDQPEVQAGVRNTLGLTYLGLGVYEDAEAHLRAALDIQTRLFGEEHLEVATTLLNLGEVFAAKGDLAGADPLIAKARDIARRVGGPESVEYADVINSLGSLRQQQGRYDEAEPLQRESLELRRKQYGNVHSKVAISLNNLGVILGMKGDYTGAEPLQRECLDILRQLNGTEHYDTAHAMRQLATVFESLKRYDEAEPLFRESIAIEERLLGSDHPQVAWSRYNYAFMEYSRGDYPRAIELAQQVLKLRGGSLPDQHPIVSGALMVQAQSLLAMGQPREAEPRFREALELREQTYGSDHWLLASTSSWLGECLLDEGRYREAEALLTKSLDSLRASLGETHQHTVAARARVERLKTAQARSS